MKRILLFLTVLFTSHLLFSQSCTPDTTNIIPGTLIYPLPYQDTVPGSGIKDKACIGSPYETIFQVNIPTTVNFQGFNVTILQVKLKSISGLPDGLTYSCSPDGCLMPGKSIGCMSIYGTPTASNAAGTYPIQLNFDFATNIGTFDLSFPSAAIAPGTYEIQLLDGSDPECSVATKPIDKFNVTKNWVDYGSQTLNIQFDANKIETVYLEIYSLDGKLVSRQSIRSEHGTNSLTADLSQCDAGMYIFQLKSGSAHVSSKIILQGK